MLIEVDGVEESRTSKLSNGWWLVRAAVENDVATAETAAKQRFKKYLEDSEKIRVKFSISWLKWEYFKAA